MRGAPEDVASAATPPAGAVGIIPYRLRVGVTGHRELAYEDALRERVARALERIRQVAPSSVATPVELCVVSPLAEGADRLVAREVLRDPHATLEASLPLPREQYLEDFDADMSRQEFDALLARAETIVVLPRSETREEAYVQVGRYVVERSDVMIALWDGAPAHGEGGTADVVALAREQGRPLFWIRTEPPFELSEELGAGSERSAFEPLDAYNRAAVGADTLGREVERQQAELAAQWTRCGLAPELLRPFSVWSVPYLARADVLAQRAQRAYLGIGTALFLVAATAVAVLAAQVLFAPDHPEIAWVEVILMLGLLGLLAIGQHLRLHERWIAYRFLAERFRSTLFLALAGTGPQSPRGGERASVGVGSHEWLRGALEEVWRRSPQLTLSEAHAEGLKRFLETAWIRDQRDYHQRASHKQHRRHRQLEVATAALFGLTLFAAVLDGLGLGHSGADAGPEWGRGLGFLGIALPALAGALGGIRAQREYQRNAERLGQMVPYLEAVGKRMARARGLAEVRAVAAAAEDVMLQENRDWFFVMRFHDFELHV